MPGPGDYRADVTEGITRVEALPKPRILTRSRNSPRATCPRGGARAARRRCIARRWHDVGDLVSGRPQDVRRTHAQPHGSHCGQSFHANPADLALPGSPDTHRGVAMAVRLVVEAGLPYRAASWQLGRDHRVFVPLATIQQWVAGSGKKRCKAGGLG